MYIYLDESYNLKDRDKKQFISINGFLVLDEKSLLKEWKRIRLPFVEEKRRIHANEKHFNKLRPRVKSLLKRNDLIILSVFQVIQEITFDKDCGYWQKGSLAFDKIYYDMLKMLMLKLHLNEYRKVNIVIDSRKHKGGIMMQKKFEQLFIKFLLDNHSGVRFRYKSQPSTTDVLLELADFISNIFYREYLKNNDDFFEKIDYNLIQLKNPLNNGFFRK